MKTGGRTAEALKLLNETKPTSMRQFGKLFWPNSPMHKNHSNCGNGGRIGAGAFLCAGSFLAKLARQGLIFVEHGDKDNLTPIARLTDKGREKLRTEAVK